jgi:DNA-binding CsgD family transcriptional regulator
MSARAAHYETRYRDDLTPRQREVLELLARGMTNFEIAQALGLSLEGAKYHVREIMAKVGAESREEAVRAWRAHNRPAARLGRAMRGLAGLFTVKAAAVIGGAAAVGAVAGLAVVLVVLATGGSESTPGVPVDPLPSTEATAVVTPSATPPAVSQTPPPTPTPAPTQAAGTPDAFRELGRELDAALRRGDSGFIADRLRAVDRVCSAADMVPGPGQFPCNFVGQEISGLWLSGWRSEGTFATAEDVAGVVDRFIAGAVPAAGDGYGDGAARVHALGVSQERWTTVITAIVPRSEYMPAGPPIRAALVLDWEAAGAGWDVTSVMTAFVLAEDLLDPTPEGRLPGWEAFAP